MGLANTPTFFRRQKKSLESITKCKACMTGTWLRQGYIIDFLCTVMATLQRMSNYRTSFNIEGHDPLHFPLRIITTWNYAVSEELCSSPQKFMME